MFLKAEHKSSIYSKKSGSKLAALFNHCLTCISMFNISFQDVVYAEELDIIFVTETCLNDNFTNNEILHKGYDIIRKDRVQLTNAEVEY